MSDTPQYISITRVLTVANTNRIESLSLEQAHLSNARVDFILVRDDGWVLGTPRSLYQQAIALYAGRWTHIIDVRVQ